MSDSMWNEAILPRFLVGQPNDRMSEWRLPLYQVASFSIPDASETPVFPRVEAVYRLTHCSGDGCPILEYKGVEVFAAASNQKVAGVVRELVEFAEQVEREAVDRIYESGGEVSLRWYVEIQSRLSDLKQRLAETGVWYPRRKSPKSRAESEKAECPPKDA